MSVAADGDPGNAGIDIDRIRSLGCPKYRRLCCRRRHDVGAVLDHALGLRGGGHIHLGVEKRPAYRAIGPSGADLPVALGRLSRTVEADLIARSDFALGKRDASGDRPAATIHTSGLVYVGRY